MIASHYWPFVRGIPQWHFPWQRAHNADSVSISWPHCRNIGNCLIPKIHPGHYSGFIMGTMASQVTGVSIVFSTVCSSAEQRKHQSSASKAFKRGIHRSPVKSPHKGPVTRKMFPFDDVIMEDELRTITSNFISTIFVGYCFQVIVIHTFVLYFYNICGDTS